MAGSIFQHELSNSNNVNSALFIAVSPSPLKQKELRKSLDKELVEERLHFGTGSVTPGDAAVPTRTYGNLAELQPGRSGRGDFFHVVHPFHPPGRNKSRNGQRPPQGAIVWCSFTMRTDGSALYPAFTDYAAVDHS